jgi:hypothetical protein
VAKPDGCLAGLALVSSMPTLRAHHRADRDSCLSLVKAKAAFQSLAQDEDLPAKERVRRALAHPAVP